MSNRIICNYHKRPILSWYELPDDQKEWRCDPQDRAGWYVLYGGYAYALSEFVRWGTPWTGPCPKELDGWHGYYVSCPFSSKLIRIVGEDEIDGPLAIIARYETNIATIHKSMTV